MTSAPPRSVLPTELLVDIAVLTAATLVADANGSLAPVHAQLARVSRDLRSALTAPATRLRILALASPFPGGDISPFVRPGWPKGLTRAEREDLLLCWLDDRLARSGKGEMAIAEVFKCSVRLVEEGDWTGWKEAPDRRTTMHLLNVAAADNHLRLVERLFRLGDAPTGFTYHKTLRNDRDDVLRLIAARSPLYFPKNGKASQLAYAAGFGALKCLRFMFGLLPRDRYADLVFGAVSRMCEDLNVNGLRGLLELEVEFREAGRPSAMEAAGDEAERAVEGLLEEARRGFFYYANLRDPSEVLKEFLGCVKLVVSLGVSPTLALQVVSDVKSWLAANGGSGDEVPELTRSEIREILGED